MSWLAAIAATLTAAGLAQAILGAWLVSRFVRPEYWRTGTAPRPPISVLKPLHGDEPLLGQALASLCAQDYPQFQIVFGVQDELDASLRVVQRLRAAFPKADIGVVYDPTQHGPNRKVGNLINMLPSAKYDVLAIADSDVHVQPDYLTRLAETLAEPDTGLVTTLYAGRPASGAVAGALGAMQISHVFLPSALIARAMGRQDCLGATMLLRRNTLARIGGFEALVGHLADDQVLGRLVRAAGLHVRLAGTVPATTVPETGLGALWRHELRWARTIRALVPGPFAGSVLQYPLFWALLAIPLSGGEIWSWTLFIFAWVIRAVAALTVDRALEPLLEPPASPSARRPAPSMGNDWLELGAPLPRGGARHLVAEATQGVAFHCPVWLLPLRDLISVAVWLASFAGRQVDWRGHQMFADTPPLLAAPKEPRPR